MAYLKKSLEDESVKNVAQTVAVPAQANALTRGTTGQTSTIQPGQTAGQAPGAAASGPSPTGYIPLQQYLQANVGAGAGTANVLSKQAEQAKSGAQSEIGKVQSTGEELAKKTQAEIEKQGTEITKALSRDPTKNVEQAKGFLEQIYQGPEASPYASQISAAQKTAEEKLNLLGTEEGKQVALESGAKQPYTKSYGSLDRYLFAQDPAAKAQFEAQQKTAKENIKSTGTAASDIVQKQIDLAKAKLGEQKTKLKKSATDVQAEATKRSEAKVNRLNKEEAARAAAFAAKEQEQGRRITDKIWTPGQAATLADVLSERGLADIEALSQISGVGLDQAQKQKGYRKGQGSYTVKV